ncbi:MAG: DNA-directed RNA polymerase subunit alpha, partial [Candidatus Paceibacteria bacterium]
FPMSMDIPLPNKPQLVEEKSENSAVYAIEPLFPGYGVTIANSLRRVMLSSLSGTAISSVRISGVDHEFSTIPNVLEDVVDISLNLKAINFRLHGVDEAKATLNVTGKKEVTAGDIETGSEVDVVNPDAPILTLSDPSESIEMELTITRGVGFVKADEHNLPREIGLIALDSVYSPVKRVSYSIEDIRVGDVTNYNKAIFEITTNGSISPYEAITHAADILVKQFQALTDVDHSQYVEEPSANTEEETEESDSEGDLESSSRSTWSFATHR